MRGLDLNLRAEPAAARPRIAGPGDRRPRRRTQLGGAGLAIITAAAVAGCGSGGHVGGHLDFRDHAAPADAVNMSVAIGGRQVLVAPARIGAGELILNVVNTSPRTQKLEVEGPSHGASAGPRIAMTAELQPGASAQLKTDLRRGRYLFAGVPRGSNPGGGLYDSGPRAPTAGRLRVGAPRSGGDSAVEQP